MSQYRPWFVAVLLGVAGFLVIALGPRYFGFSPQDNAALSGALGGALVGAAGALLGMVLMDQRQRMAADESLRQRRENVKKLVTAELVNVAMGVINFKKTMDIAIQAVTDGGTLPESEHFGRDMPRGMPLTDRLGADLLIFDPDAIDALVTLKSNLERTGEAMLEITSGRRRFGSLAAQQLSVGLQHDMGILAECFEQFAPTRRFDFEPGRGPELVSAALRRLAKTNLADVKLGI